MTVNNDFRQPGAGVRFDGPGPAADGMNPNVAGVPAGGGHGKDGTEGDTGFRQPDQPGQGNAGFTEPPGLRRGHGKDGTEGGADFRANAGQPAGANPTNANLAGRPQGQGAEADADFRANAGQIAGANSPNANLAGRPQGQGRDGTEGVTDFRRNVGQPAGVNPPNANPTGRPRGQGKDGTEGGADFRPNVGQPAGANAPLTDPIGLRRGQGRDGTEGDPRPAVGNGAADRGLNADAGIRRLNSDGDKTTVTLAGGITTQIGGGHKGRFDLEINVAQKGGAQPGQPRAPNDPPATFVVSIDAKTLNGVLAGLPTPLAGAETEPGLKKNDTVSLSFASKEDAQRAVGLLQRHAVANTLDDAANLIGAKTPGTLTDGKNPTPGSTVPGANLALNLREGSGSASADLPKVGPGGLAMKYTADQVRPAEGDQQWLRQNISSVSSSVALQGRDAVTAGFTPPGPLGAALVGRFDHVAGAERTIDYDKGAPTKLSHDVSGSVRLGSTSLSNLSANLDPAKAGVYVAALGDSPRANVTAGLSWDIPPGASGGTDSSLSGRRGALEDELLRSNALGQPNALNYAMSARMQEQSAAGLPPSDYSRLNVEAKIDNPRTSDAQAIDQLFNGDLRAAITTAGDAGQVSVNVEAVNRTGTEAASGPPVQLTDAVTLEAADFVKVDSADVVDRIDLLNVGQGLPVDEGAVPIENEPPAPSATSVPIGTENQAGTGLVVTPRDGLRLRTEPEGGSINVFRHGDFIKQTGEPLTSADGYEWIPVEGRTVDGARREGWVSSDYVRLHPPETGAMTSNGRTNPQLEAAAYQRIDVQEGETLWDVARQNGSDFNALVTLNNNHIIKPDLVFEGDAIFLPGTAGQAVLVDISDVSTSPGISGSSGAGALTSADVSTLSSSSALASTTEQTSLSEALAQTGGVTSSGENSPAETIASPTLASVAGSGNPIATEEMNDNPTMASPTEKGSTDEMAAGRRNLDEIRADFQVESEPGEVEWRPNVGGFDVPGGFDDVIGRGIDHTGLGDLPSEGLTLPMRPTEAAILDQLGSVQQADYLEISTDALERAQTEYPRPVSFQGDSLRWGNDGHLDSFRHAYWSARMTHAFGEDWTRAYTNAHEAYPDNEANREAMDLYNNGIGIETALANPDATADDLSELVKQRIEDGDMVLVAADGSLAWSDQVPLGGHGEPRGGPGRGVIPLADPAEVRVH